jgi:L-ascorbate metabolism protein UlaG (beta-lactamase superfamily)
MSSQIGSPGTVTWLGHGSLLLVTGSGTRVVFDPWLEGNPTCPYGTADLGQVDGIAVTHGHFDHIGSVESLAAATGAPVVSTPELSAYFALRGVGELVEMNKGGTVVVGDVELTMVSADHSCGVSVGENVPNVYGGDPVGFIARPNRDGAGSIYVSGDTNVFGDMRLIRELYAPEIGFFPIDGHYNMGPREAAYAVELLGLSRAVPIHFGTFPLLAGTPEEFTRELGLRGTDAEAVVIEPGGSVAVGAGATSR